MQQLEALTLEATTLASPAALLTADEEEVNRVMTICNACRYCEGFCAVFPAMTRLLEFKKADIHYLANVCHNCGACLHACQYAPPHEFGVNVPKALARVRAQTYSDFAWPPSLGVLYERAGLTLSLATALAVSLFLVLALAVTGSVVHAPLAGDFYAVFPHNLLVLMFGTVFLFAILALGMGVSRFWREVSPTVPLQEGRRSAVIEASRDALVLKYLDGGHGEGCNDEDDRYTLRRRRFHHFTFYGFMLCFASTSVATLYHYFLDYPAPYPVLSVPVILGIVGGVGLLIGPAGLMWLYLRRNGLHRDATQKSMDTGFIALLFVISLTGLALLAFRDTGYMALLLAIHLGSVMALFLTMPYGKFAHAGYRCAALLKNSIEKRRPNHLGFEE